MNLSAERVSVQSAALKMGINFTLICVCLLGLPRRLYRRAEDRQTDSVNANSLKSLITAYRDKHGFLVHLR